MLSRDVPSKACMCVRVRRKDYVAHMGPRDIHALDPPAPGAFTPNLPMHPIPQNTDPRLGGLHRPHPHCITQPPKPFSGGVWFWICQLTALRLPHGHTVPCSPHVPQRVPQVVLVLRKHVAVESWQHNVLGRRAAERGLH